MGLRDRLNGRNTQEADLREQLKSVRWQAEHFEESLRDLEQQITGDEPGWRRLYGQLQHDFTRAGLDDLMKMSRAMYMSNPLIQRAVNVSSYYVWAQGVGFHAADPTIQDLVVDPMIEDEYNRQEFYGHQALILTDVDQRVDGNTFAALFTAPDGDVQVRTIPANEIREVIVDPEDSAKVWFYRRRWSQAILDTNTGSTDLRNEEALYPCVRYQPTYKPDNYGRVPIYWDAPILHQRTGGLKHMLFGVPETYAAIDWARAYKEFLEDWHTIVASLARFAWKATSSKSRLAKLKEKIGGRRASELEDVPMGQPRPPIPGSIIGMAQGEDLTPISKSGATTSAEDAKASRMMVASAMDLPDTILSSDPQQGALATAKTLDRPTELGFRSRQSLWSEYHEAIFRYRMNTMVRLGQLPGRKERVSKDTMYVEPSVDPKVDVKFPPILEHDVGETVTAIVTAATLAGHPDAGVIPREETSKALMSAIGIEDVQDALEQLDKMDGEAVQQAVETLRTMIEREEKHAN
jgi:hypothetical protein